ncbi:MAG: MFS transporter [Pirellulales bacterium]|nr:MFS transporter [Pirellulales bacterium]
MNDPRRDLRPAYVLGLAAAYGVVHAILDAPCAALLVRLRVSASLPENTVWILFIIYSCLAFGLQFSIGALADRTRGYQAAMLLGLGMLCLAITVFLDVPQVALVLAGIGNAVFHVGAGAIVLRLSPRRALAAGLYVAPGSIGLALGGWCAQAVPHWNWLLLGPLLAGMALVWVLDGQTVSQRRPFPAPIPIRRPVACLAVAALVISVAVRAALGLTVSRVHNGESYVLLLLAVAACLGKVSGGLLADRLGWIKTSVVALLLSAPLLGLFTQSGPLVIVGMLLFQMTMPVTLLAVYRVFPEEPGLAFGIPSLAILLGALPVFVLPLDRLAGSATLLFLIAISIAALLVGLPPLLRPKSQACSH